MNNILEQIEALKEKRKPLIDTSNILEKQIHSISKQIHKLQEQQTILEIASLMTESEQIEYFLFEDGLVAGERYKARSKFWSKSPLYLSGYNPETKQSAFKLKLIKGGSESLESTISEIERILPFIKANNGVKKFGVFEHTLSEGGSYSVEITENSYSLYITSWSRTSLIKSFDNLRELVQYVQKHHYYQDIDEDEE